MGSNNGKRKRRLKHYVAIIPFFLVIITLREVFVTLQMPTKAQTPENVQMPKKVQTPEEVQTPEKVQTPEEVQMPEEVQTPEEVLMALEGRHSFHSVREYFKNCDTIYKEGLPIPSKETWRKYRETYVSVVGEMNSTIGDPVADFNGVPVSHFVKQSPGRGRGIFAGEDITEGTLFGMEPDLRNSRTVTLIKNFSRILMISILFAISSNGHG